MTKNEQEIIDKLYGLMSQMKAENEAFRKQILDLTRDLETKVAVKHLPVTLEQDILSTVQITMQTAIKEALVKYDSPLIKLVTTVVNDHSVELKQLISDSFSEVIRTEDFKASIRTGFAHKVSRTLISNNSGLFDKVSNELKQDSIFKAKMALAVENVVNECLTERKTVE